MSDADLLNQLLLWTMKLVKIAVYLLETHIFLEVSTEIVDSRLLAHWRAYTWYDQMPQFLILDRIETDTVKNLTDYCLRGFQRSLDYIWQDLFGNCFLFLFEPFLFFIRKDNSWPPYRVIQPLPRATSLTISSSVSPIPMTLSWEYLPELLSTTTILVEPD